MYPITRHVNTEGVVEIGGVDIRLLAKEYGTPLWVIDETTLRENCRAYTRTLATSYPHSTVVYASKAGLTVGLAKIILEENLGLDVVSGGEIMTAIKAGANPDKVYFHGNNKDENELKLAIQTGIKIVLDNEQEVREVIDIGKALAKKPKVLIRLKPGIEAHTHDYIKTGQIDSKFGIEKDRVVPVIKRLLDDGNVEFLGIHGHIGSQIFDRTPYEDLARIMVSQLIDIRETLGLDVRELNLGGGIGIPYTKQDDPPSIASIVASMTTALKEALKAAGLPEPKLILEPGRSIVATSGVTLYTVGRIKSIPGIKDYVFVDGGMADNPRPILYQALYTFEIGTRANQNPSHSYTIAGKFCESGDILGKDIPLAKPEKNDIMVVYATGAYNYAMSSNYNRFLRPAMVVVRDGKIKPILRRESYEDILKNDL